MGKQVHSDWSIKKARGISNSNGEKRLCRGMACLPECPLSRGVSERSYTTTVAAQCCIHDQLSLKLSEYFGHSTFRFGQEDAILAVLHKNDVFVRMATGAGKSLCMFLPPLVYSSSSLAVIISPLISLMDDQVFVMMYLSMTVMIIIFRHLSRYLNL